MASGLPDYLKDYRLRLGGAKSALGIVQVKKNDITELVEVTGKGMIYGGVVHLTATATQKSGEVTLTIDDEIISVINFSTLNLYTITQPYAYPLSLVHYDDTAFRYAVAINYGFTFEKNFKVEYTEDQGARPYVVCRVCYALI